MRRNRTYRQKRAASSTTVTIAPKRRRTSSRYKGLVPSYQGYNFRQFSLGEWKFVDTTGAVSMTTTPGLYLLNGLAQGSSASQRIGTKVSFRTCEMRFYISPNSPDYCENQVVRFMLVLDRQPNAAAPSAITDILQTNSITSPRNLNARRRFKIMYDKSLAMGTQLTASGKPGNIPSWRTGKLFMRFRRTIITEYNGGSAGTIADIATNSIYLVTYGTQTLASSMYSNLTHTIRLRYTDM